MKRILIYILTGLLIGCSTTKDFSEEGEIELPDDVLSNQKYILHQTFIDGLTQLTINNYDRALELFKACEKMDGENAAIQYELAKTYTHLANISLAMQHIDKAIEFEDDNVWYHLHKARLLQYSNLNAEAAVAYKKVIDLNPTPKYLVGYIQTLIYSEQIEEAIKALDELQDKVGANPELINQKYQLYIELGKDKEAGKMLEDIIKGFPYEIDYMGMLAYHYNQRGQHEKAIEIYKKILELDPLNPRVHMSLYEYYISQKQDEKAYDHLSKVFRSDDMNVDDKMQVLIDIYENTERKPGKREMVYPILETLIATHPDEAKVFSIYGDYLVRDDYNKKARDKFAKAVELDQSKYVIWNQLMYLDMQINDHESLLEHSEQALELFPNQPGVYFFKGHAQYKLKNYEEAVTTLKNGLSMIIDNPDLQLEFYRTLGDANFQAGNRYEAYQYFDLYLKEDPDNVYVLNNYAYYLSIDNQNLNTALEMANKVNKLMPSQPSYMDTKAWVLFRQKKYTEAKTLLEKAIDLEGEDNGVILEHLGDVYYHLDQPEKAMEYWKKAQKTGSHSGHLEEKLKMKKYVE